MANFIQAMDWMEEGYKVRSASWENEEYYWHIDTNFTFDNLWCIKDKYGDEACMIRSWIEKDDWEIYSQSKATKQKTEKA